MLKRTRHLASDNRGLAAVEFALIAPVMILMFYGAVELSTAVDCNSRVARVSSTVADLVAQATAVSSADTTNIFNAANAILYPYASANAQIKVSSLVANSAGTVSVAWSDAQNTSPRTSPPGNIPTGIIPAGSSIIYAEVSYTFTPAISYFLGGSVTMTNVFYSKPRRSIKVAHS
jgi:Flp pilus assembly protein TadG